MQDVIFRLFCDFYPRNLTVRDVRAILGDSFVDIEAIIQNLLVSLVVMEVSTGVFVLNGGYIRGVLDEF